MFGRQRRTKPSVNANEQKHADPIRRDLHATEGAPRHLDDVRSDLLNMRQRALEDRKRYDQDSFADGKTIPLMAREIDPYTKRMEHYSYRRQHDDTLVGIQLIAAAKATITSLKEQDDDATKQLEDLCKHKEETQAKIDRNAAVLGTEESRLTDPKKRKRKTRAVWALSLLFDLPLSYFALQILGGSTYPTIFLAAFLGAGSVWAADDLGKTLRRARLLNSQPEVTTKSTFRYAVPVLLGLALGLLATFFGLIRAEYVSFATAALNQSGSKGAHFSLPPLLVGATFAAASVIIWIVVATKAYHQEPLLDDVDQLEAEMEQTNQDRIHGLEALGIARGALEVALHDLHNKSAIWDHRRQERRLLGGEMLAVYMTELLNAIANADTTAQAELLDLLKRIGVEPSSQEWSKSTAPDDSMDADDNIVPFPGDSDDDADGEEVKKS